MNFREIAYGSEDYRRERALRDEILRKPLGLTLGDEQLEAERGQWHFGLFDRAGGLVGCVVVVPPGAGDTSRPGPWHAGSEARLRQMAVAEPFQRQGHGRRLIAAVESLLAVRGVTRLVLHARQHVVPFYEKLGYRVVGDEFIEVTIPHRRMEKTLSSATR
jgi:predicted GNAT family N-acyltransferase